MFAFQPSGRELHEFLTMAQAHQAEAVISRCSTQSSNQKQKGNRSGSEAACGGSRVTRQSKTVTQLEMIKKQSANWTLKKALESCDMTLKFADVEPLA
jgi:hypothetical protein